MQRPCACCLTPFAVASRHRLQRYCGRQSCRRERRNRWQRAKLKADADYRENQAHAQQRWRAKHPDYWKEYRRAHPEYVERNRQLQKQRRERRDAPLGSAARPERRVAKMDLVGRQPVVRPRLYWLSPAEASGVAKMDSVLVQVIDVKQVAGTG